MLSKKMILSALLVAVVGLAGAGCSDDNPVEPSTIDEAPIIPPTKLTVEMDKGKARLEWGPSVDNRVVNYFVERENKGSRVLLGRTGNSETQFLDETPELGTSTYYVSAAGSGPRQSSAASVTLTLTLSHRTDNLKD